VHVGVLHHKHGEDVFVGWTRKQVYSKVYQYIKLYWCEFAIGDEKLPRKHLDAIEAYFAPERAGDTEWLDILTDTLPV
jgi:hypothetical protein